jgi:hypothetical protein
MMMTRSLAGCALRVTFMDLPFLMLRVITKRTDGEPGKVGEISPAGGLRTRAGTARAQGVG